MVTLAADITVDLPAKVDIDISENASFENQPINGTITIIRELKQKVDETSFTLDGKSAAMIKRRSPRWPARRSIRTKK